jgi:hypothetical protein
MLRQLAGMPGTGGACDPLLLVERVRFVGHVNQAQQAVRVASCLSLYC